MRKETECEKILNKVDDAIDRFNKYLDREVDDIYENDLLLALISKDSILSIFEIDKYNDMFKENNRFMGCLDITSKRLAKYNACCISDDHGIPIFFISENDNMLILNTRNYIFNYISNCTRIDFVKRIGKYQVYDLEDIISSMEKCYDKLIEEFVETNRESIIERSIGYGFEGDVTLGDVAELVSNNEVKIKHFLPTSREFNKIFYGIKINMLFEYLFETDKWIRTVEEFWRENYISNENIIIDLAKYIKVKDYAYQSYKENKTYLEKYKIIQEISNMSRVRNVIVSLKTGESIKVPNKFENGFIGDGNKMYSIDDVIKIVNGRKVFYREDMIS